MNDLKVNLNGKIKPIRDYIERKPPIHIHGIDLINNMVERMVKKQAREFDEFILEHLEERGYPIEYIKHCDCHRDIKRVDEKTEEHYFYVDGECVLIVRKTIIYGCKGNTYVSDMKLEVF